jgi:ABC-type amino acid transport substrate-binding protein
MEPVAAVAALTITAEREKHFDFSHPFHTRGLGIAVLQIKKSFYWKNHSMNV